MKPRQIVLLAGLISVFGVLVFSMAARAAIPEQGGDFPQNVCKNLWWRDSSHPNCSQKEFCAKYVYRGLLTFETEAACQSKMTDQTSPVNPTKGAAISWPRRIILQVQEFFASILARFFPSIQNIQQEIPTKIKGTPTEPDKFCGGSPYLPCPQGYSCKVKNPQAPPTSPDSLGTCIKEIDKNQPVYDCGGFMGTQCPSGYKCKILGGDAGTCVKSGLFGF